jgi:hypothetical protein
MARFERALQIGRPSIVLAAAHELPKPVQLRDALRILLVLLDGEPERFPAAAARFGARLVSERRLSIIEGQLVFAALATLASPDPLPGREALETLLEHHGEHDGARHLGIWLRTHEEG